MIYILLLLCIIVLIPLGIEQFSLQDIIQKTFLRDSTFVTPSYQLPTRESSLLSTLPIAPQDQTDLTYTSQKHPLVDINRTQQLYLQLAQFCEKYTSKKPILLKHTTYTLYVPQTRPLPVKLDMEKISNILLPWMKQELPMCTFHTTNYDRIEVYEDKQKNIQYRYTWFVYDSEYQFSLGFDIDVIKYVQPSSSSSRSQKVFTCTSTTPQPKEEYTIGIPSKDQMIPLAMDVIPTGKEILRMDSIRKNEYPEPVEIVLNRIQLRHSTLTLAAESVPLNKKMKGVSDNQLEYRPLHKQEKQTHTPYYEEGEKRNKWILPPDSPQQNKEIINGWNQYPCTVTQFDTWDENGIYTPHKNQTTQCPGYVSSTERMPQQPYNNPTVGKYPWFGGAYGWLFNLEYWIPSFPFAQSP
jgi:hypothetical protein